MARVTQNGMNEEGGQVTEPALSFAEALEKHWAENPEALETAIQSNPTAFSEGLLEGQKWYNNPTQWEGEVDTKNLQMSGLDEDQYRLFRSRLNSLNWNLDQGNLNPEQWNSAFGMLTKDMGVPTMVEGTDKIYWMDPGSGINPYGSDIAGNFGDRPGMYIRDSRTDGDASLGSIAEGTMDALSDPSTLLSIGMMFVPGGQGFGAAQLMDIGRQALTSGLMNSNTGNYGIEDPLEGAEGPMIGDTPVMSRPGWKWVQDATSVSGWKVVPDDDPEGTSGGGGGSGSQGGGAPSTPPEGTDVPNGGNGGSQGPAEDVWVFKNGVLENVVSGDIQEVPNTGRLEEGALYNQDGEPIGNDATQEEEEYDEFLVTGPVGNLGDWYEDVFGDDEPDDGEYGITVTNNPAGQPGINVNGTQNGMTENGDQYGPGETPGQGQGSDGTGEGDGGEGEGDGLGGSGALSEMMGTSSGEFQPFMAGLSYEGRLFEQANIQLVDFFRELENRSL